jgi:predicted DNA-binding transcriptional regulator AlpA
MAKITPTEGRKTYLRKRGVAQRYSCDKRTVDRMVEDKRIPPPKYLPNSPIPIWAEDELIANERRATATPRTK